MKNFFKIIRWKNILIIAITMFVMKYAIILPIYDYFAISFAFSGTGFLFLVLGIMFLVSGGNVINDYFDRRTDMINRPDEVLVVFSISRRQAILIHLFFTLFGTICGFIASSYIGKTSFGFIFILAAIIILLYSTKYKKKAFIGNIIASILTGCVPLIVGLTEFYSAKFSGKLMIPDYALASKTYLYIILGFSIFASLFSLIYGLIKYCINYEGDKETGIRSIPVLIGKKNTNYIIGSLTLFTTISIIIAERVFLPELPFFRNNNLSSYYIYFFIVLPCIIMTISSYVGTEKRKYVFLEMLTKIIMLFGILFSLVFSFIIHEYIS